MWLTGNPPQTPATFAAIGSPQLFVPYWSWCRVDWCLYWKGLGGIGPGWESNSSSSCFYQDAIQISVWFNRMKAAWWVFPLSEPQQASQVNWSELGVGGRGIASCAIHSYLDRDLSSTLRETHSARTYHHLQVWESFLSSRFSTCLNF